MCWDAFFGLLCKFIRCGDDSVHLVSALQWFHINMTYFQDSFEYDTLQANANGCGKATSLVGFVANCKPTYMFFFLNTSGSGSGFWKTRLLPFSGRNNMSFMSSTSERSETGRTIFQLCLHFLGVTERETNAMRALFPTASPLFSDVVAWPLFWHQLVVSLHLGTCFYKVCLL